MNLIYTWSSAICQICFDLKLWSKLFCKILGMAQGLNLIFGWDLFTCVFLTATGAVFHILLAVLFVSITLHLFTIPCWSTLDLLYCLCVGHWEGKIPRTVCGRLCITFFYTWSIHPIKSSSFREWNTNKVKWGECIYADESSRSNACASQLLPSFFYCTGILSSNSQFSFMQMYWNVCVYGKLPRKYLLFACGFICTSSSACL